MVRSKRWGAEKDAQLSDCSRRSAGGGGREGPRGRRHCHWRRRQPRLTMPPPPVVCWGAGQESASPPSALPNATVHRRHRRGPVVGLLSGREVTPRSGDGGGDRRIGCKGHCPPPPSGSKQKTQSPVGGDNDNDTTVHDNDSDDDAGGGDRALQFDGICWSRIRGLVAGRRQSHSEVDNGNVPARLHGGMTTTPSLPLRGIDDHDGGLSLL